MDEVEQSFDVLLETKQPLYEARNRKVTGRICEERGWNVRVTCAWPTKVAWTLESHAAFFFVGPNEDTQFLSGIWIRDSGRRLVFVRWLPPPSLKAFFVKYKKAL